MTNDKQIEPNIAPAVITQEALAHLGDGRSVLRTSPTCFRRRRKSRRA
jgi:hypothetical protein